jgi:CHAT domain-containing protein
VNISANASAVCHPRAAEQQLSFPTAFVLSGAAHVLTTIWAASPRSRGAFHEAFYRCLAEGLHPADARSRAVRHLRDIRRRDGVDPHPVRWATFTHFGSAW